MTYLDNTDQYLQDVADRVNSHAAKAIDELIAAGRVLLEAKENTFHGNFERLFRDHPSPVPSPIQMSARYGRNLMKMANNEVIVARWRELPKAVEALVALDDISEEKLEALIDSGSVTPATTAVQAKSIVTAIKTGDFSTKSEHSSEMAPKMAVFVPPVITVRKREPKPYCAEDCIRDELGKRLGVIWGDEDAYFEAAKAISEAVEHFGSIEALEQWADSVNIVLPESKDISAAMEMVRDGTYIQEALSAALSFSNILSLAKKS